MTLEESLNKFRERFPLIRVTQYDDCLVYKVQSGFSKRCVVEANELIDDLELPLVARYTGDDSFVIEKK